MGLSNFARLFSSCTDLTLVESSSSSSSSSIKSSSSDLEAHFEKNPTVRIVPITEYKQAALTLAEAFAEDDVARYFIDTPDRVNWSEKQKWNLHLSILEYITYAHCMRGLVLCAGENYGCVALWMPPGRNMDDLYTTIKSGMWRLNYRLSREGRIRFFDEFYPLLHDTKAAVLGDRDDESWYLVYIGTRPSSRGLGLARRCIEAVTKLADEQGLPCYLESSNDINPAIYAKMGFEHRCRIELERASKRVGMDCMVKESAMVETRYADLAGERSLVKKE